MIIHTRLKHPILLLYSFGLTGFGGFFVGRGVGLFPFCGVKAQRLCILGDSTFGLILCTVGEAGLDLDADINLGIWIGGKCCDYFFGDLHEAHLGGGWGDCGGAVK